MEVFLLILFAARLYKSKDTIHACRLCTTALGVLAKPKELFAEIIGLFLILCLNEFNVTCNLVVWILKLEGGAEKRYSTYILFPGMPRFHSSIPCSPRPLKDRFVVRCSKVEQISFTESENSLIEALLGIQGRGRSSSPQQLNAVERAVQVLERLGGVPDPTNSNLIEGRWQLIFTTRPGTASPIQFLEFDIISLYIYFVISVLPSIENLAAASIEDGKRILFRFDRAAFSFKFLPFKVPYPVPFRLLGDEAKGWLDTTYLSSSGNLHISKGNKVIRHFQIISNISIVQGTTFVLQKQTEPRQRLLTAISSGKGIKEAIDELISLKQNIGQEPELEDGEWQMMWNSQTVTDSWIENAVNGLMGKQIIRKNGGIKFLVDILLGLKFSMSGNFVTSLSAFGGDYRQIVENLWIVKGLDLEYVNEEEGGSSALDKDKLKAIGHIPATSREYIKTGSGVYDVTMDDAAIIGGPFGYPLELKNNFILELLYSDEKLRVSRGINNVIFVHVRTDALR
ncbi:putative plastid-lipid-associated protein 12, chloroplastic [Glycine soja]